MSANPYSLVFGKEPKQLLSRYPDNYSIIDDFESENSNHIFMLTGIRGVGKTVAMTTIAKHFKQLEDWYVINLSPNTDLVRSLAAELGEIAESRTGKTDEIKEILNLKQNELNPYRKRLMDKGVITSPSRGVMKFTLPYFDEYVKKQDEEW